MLLCVHSGLQFFEHEQHRLLFSSDCATAFAAVYLGCHRIVNTLVSSCKFICIDRLRAKCMGAKGAGTPPPSLIPLGVVMTRTSKLAGIAFNVGCCTMPHRLHSLSMAFIMNVSRRNGDVSAGKARRQNSAPQKS